MTSNGCYWMILVDVYKRQEYPKKSFVVCLDDVNTEAERVKMKDLARLVEKEIRNYN